MNKSYALIGFPLSHTLSPQIHSCLFALSGDKTSSYKAIEIPRERFLEESERLFSYDGFNVTIPYKIPILSMLDKLDISAKRYGAVNTVLCGKGQKRIGYNTDVDGFLRALEELGASLHAKVLLLGCGGVGRMMAIETVRAGGALTIAVRDSSYEKAHSMQENILALDNNAKVRIVSIDSIPNESFDLVLNATPVGMFPNSQEIPIDSQTLQRVSYLFDTIYNPGQTRLMQQAKTFGVKTAGGMSMLVWQAAAAHEIWNSCSFSTKDINQIVEQMQDYVQTFDKNGGKE